MIKRMSNICPKTLFIPRRTEKKITINFNISFFLCFEKPNISNCDKIEEKHITRSQNLQTSTNLMHVVVAVLFPNTNEKISERKKAFI